jgi:hypothetical protein
MMAWARRQFPGGVPEWFFLNEISRGAWTDPGERGVRYRRYVAQVASRLHTHHGRKVVVFSPFWRPGWDGRHRYPAAWQAIALNAYVGVENYLSGASIAANGFSESWCRSRYRASIAAYGSLGVPRSRLFLTEHFGVTPRGTSWGRAGASNASWLRAIRLRTRAARSLDFAGYVTYAYSWNRAHRPSAERTAAFDAYHRVGARRLAFPDASHVSRDGAGDADPFSPGTDAEPEHDPGAGDPAGVDTGTGADTDTGTDDGTGTGDGSGGGASDPPPPPDEPPCEPRTCGGQYNDWCGGAPDGCGETLSCGDTCGTGLNCTGTGVCKKALGQACAGPGQCASGFCHWVTSAGSAARCCHQIGQWCDSDLKCCGSSVCRSGRCVAP